jgi:hypothetical protein
MERRRSRIAGLAGVLIAVLLGLVIYQYAYVGIQTEMAQVSETEAEKTKTLEKYVAAISEKPELERTLAALKQKRKTDDSKIMEGETAALSSAKLGDTIKGLIAGRGGTISSERAEKPDEVGKFKSVSVSMDVTLPDTKALADVLFSIETSTPYMVVRELDVRVTNFREPRDLSIRMRVAALTGGK